ncbi:MAG TPA: BA14K family protein [Devosiaceae bacterium]|nr:BA14K family protein [Devosiaceae bacterium]
MHKLFATIGAVAMAITLQFSAATPTRANPAVIAAAIGFGLLGLGVGAAIAGPYFGRGYYRGTGYYGGGTGYYGATGLYGGGAYPASYNVGSGHVQACAQAYRSYNPGSDTYLGYDGLRHQCLL